MFGTPATVLYGGCACTRLSLGCLSPPELGCAERPCGTMPAVVVGHAHQAAFACPS